MYDFEKRRQSETHYPHLITRVEMDKRQRKIDKAVIEADGIP